MKNKRLSNTNNLPKMEDEHVYFPEKVESAKAFLKKHPIPDHILHPNR